MLLLLAVGYHCSYLFVVGAAVETACFLR
jgi:hypothetical protein